MKVAIQNVKGPFYHRVSQAYVSADVAVVKCDYFPRLMKALESKDTKRVINEASLRFTIDYKRGSPAIILHILSDCKLTLTKIQSMPIIETSRKYAFFCKCYF